MGMDGPSQHDVIDMVGVFQPGSLFSFCEIFRPLPYQATDNIVMVVVANSLPILFVCLNVLMPLY